MLNFAVTTHMNTPITIDEKLEMVRGLCETLREFHHNNVYPALHTESFSKLHHSLQELRYLIRQTSEQEAKIIMADPEVHANQTTVQKLRAYYEAISEQEQARKLLRAPDPKKVLNDYMQSELPITTLHTENFFNQTKKASSCLLIGCGAFPSTAVLLLTKTQLSLTCIDRCETSCHLGAQVLAATGQPQTTFQAINAMDLACLERWDMVFVSALAGIDWEESHTNSRQELTAHLVNAAKPGTLIFFRSAYALGKLIYPTIDPTSFADCRISIIPAPIPGRSSLIVVEK